MNKVHPLFEVLIRPVNPEKQTEPPREIFQKVIKVLTPHSYCPICKSGDKRSKNIKVCDKCALKLKTLNDEK